MDNREKLKLVIWLVVFGVFSSRFAYADTEDAATFLFLIVISTFFVGNLIKFSAGVAMISREKKKIIASIVIGILMYLLSVVALFMDIELTAETFLILLMIGLLLVETISYKLIFKKEISIKKAFITCLISNSVFVTIAVILFFSFAFTLKLLL